MAALVAAVLASIIIAWWVLTQTLERMTAEINERKRAEAKYRALVENISVVVYLDKADESSSSSYISPQIETLLGYPPSAYAETPTLWHKQIDPRDYQRAVRTIQETLEQGKAVEEYRLIARDGRMVWVRDSSVLIRDRDGNPEFIQGFLEDITELKRAEQRLRESEARNRAMLQAIPDLMFIYSRDGIYLDYHATDPSGLFVPPEKFLGQSVQDVLPKVVAAPLVALFEQVLATGKIQIYEYQLPIAGQLRYFEARIAPYGNDRVLSIIREITERKQLEARLLQVQKMEAIGRLAGGIAHDFNNILVPIIGYAELGLMKLLPDDDLYVDLIRIRKAADRAASLTRQILAFSRNQVLEMRVLDLNAVIVDFSEMIRHLIGEDIELQTFLDSSLVWIKADKGQLEQVLLNLALNARDAMPTGGKLIFETANVYLDEGYAKKYVGAQVPGYYTMLAVSDTGHGMDAETKECIFEPFFTTKEEGKGTGLGLATVFGIIKQHGGNIWVYSEPGNGATFKIYLPQVKDVAQAPVIATMEENLSLDGTGTILVVEDEDMVRHLVCETLAARGYKVIEAQGSTEALQLATEYEETIHLLLTDVIMPDMNGRELYHKMVASHPEIRVLYMSGYTDHAIVHHGVLDEAVNFLQKPFTVNNLTQKVKSSLQ
jgi:PAS domain S-box-containing protein